MVLVGRTGAGKSSSGNTILGRDAFKAVASHSSVTGECIKQQEGLFNKMVSVVDTPGLFDTSLPEETVKREISKCINMSAPGPHAILLVIKVGRFSAEQRQAVNKVEEIFGEGAWRYTIILFTHGDEVEGDFDKTLKKADPKLNEVLQKAGNRYHLFNNLKVHDRGQVLELLEKVERMVEANGGEFYSNPTYLEVVKMLEQRTSELKGFYEKKLQEDIQAVELKYKKKLAETEDDKQQVEKRLQSELEEVKRYYHALEKGVSQVVELITEDESFNKLLRKFNETLKLN